MELFVETLTGTAFELRVSPFETIMSVKAKIQRLEGIPISQQHLIWQSIELEDDYCLHDYNINNGATLKLVLAMRGGPINTRRVPVEDSTLRDMAEYMDANHEDFVDKVPSSRHVTLLVFREGDHLNFFRVVDRGDGTLTPLSETMSASVINFNDDDEDENATPKEKLEENDKMKEKMDKLRVDLDKLNIGKKKTSKPLPPLRNSSLSSSSSSLPSIGLKKLPPTGQQTVPSSGQPSVLSLNQPSASTSDETIESLNLQSVPLSGKPSFLSLDQPNESSSGHPCLSSDQPAVSSSGEAVPSTSQLTVSGSQTSVLSAGESNPPSRTSSRMRLRQMLNTPGRPMSRTLNKNTCLPPVGRTVSSHSVAETNSSVDLVPFMAPGAADDPKFWSDGSDNGGPTLDVVNEDSDDDTGVDPVPSKKSLDVPNDIPTSYITEMLNTLATPIDTSNIKLRPSPSEASVRAKHALVIGEVLFETNEMIKNAKKKPPESCLGTSKTADSRYKSDGPYKQSPSAAKKEKTVGLRDSKMRLPTTSSKHSGEKRKEFALESLSTRETHAMSGLLQQASIEKIGSSRIVSCRSSGCSSSHIMPIPRRDDTLLDLWSRQNPCPINPDLLSSSSHHLPPVVKTKKKSKRCHACAKKTGLATSYTCRCGKNFCATHRYAESHGCTFDYKSEGRKLLEQSNPVVSAPKLPKI